MFCQKAVLRNLTKFARQHLCRSLFFNKVEGMRPVGKQENRCKPATLSKVRSPMLVFSNEFLEVFQDTFFHSTPPAVTSGRHQSVVFITNFKKRPTVLLISLLLTWNMFYYAKIEESHNEYCFLF